MGHVTIVVDRGTRELVGAAMACPDASAAIHECVVAIKAHLTIDVLAETIHAFPSTSRIFNGLFADARRELRQRADRGLTSGLPDARAGSAGARSGRSPTKALCRWFRACGTTVGRTGRRTSPTKALCRWFRAYGTTVVAGGAAHTSTRPDGPTRGVTADEGRCPRATP